MAKNFAVENPHALRDALLSVELVASESVLRQAAVAGARIVHAEVKLRAPVDLSIYEGKSRGRHPPGFLRRNIIIAYDKENSVPGRIASYIVTWSREAFYGRFLEFGTSRMAAQPFLRPAFEAKRKEIAAAIDEVIQKKSEELQRGQ